MAQSVDAFFAQIDGTDAPAAGGGGGRRGGGGGSGRGFGAWRGPAAARAGG